MAFAIKRSIFAHSFLNPPAEDRSCDINLKLVNASEKIVLEKEAPGIQTRYLLTISDSSLIGLTSSDQAVVGRAVRDLVLSFNLRLERACLSTLEGNLPSAEIKLHPQGTKVIVEQTPEGSRVNFVETVHLRDTLHITMGFSDEIDEKQALTSMEKVVRLNRHDIRSAPNIKTVNLAKALNEYESAMSVFDRLRIFKNLFNTLEFCANWDGLDRAGPSLDSEIASVSGANKSDVGDWRLLYARTKHVDRTPVDASQFVTGIEKLTSILPPIREADKRLIIDRLNQT